MNEKFSLLVALISFLGGWAFGYSYFNQFELKNKLIKFGNWLTKDYTPDNGIGYWNNFINDDSHTTEELCNKFLQIKKDTK